MTLTTHIAIAAAVTHPFMGAHPAVIFSIAVASHYLADAVPHWDYRLASMGSSTIPREKRWSGTVSTVRMDIVRAGSDALIGAILVFLVARPSDPVAIAWLVASIIGGPLPDAMQGVYYIFKHPRWLAPLQRFHDHMHSKVRLGYYPLIGIPFQLAILLGALALIR